MADEENGDTFMVDMVKYGRALSRSRFFRTLFYCLACGWVLVMLNIAFGLNLMSGDIIFKGADSFLPIPPFWQRGSEQERKHRERMAVFQRIFEKHAQMKPRRGGHKDQVCKHPHLDLKHDGNSYDLPPLNCSQKNLFYIENRIVKLNGSVLDNQELEKCVYLGIERVTDDYFTYTESIEKTEKPYDIILQQDFLRIQCYLKNKKVEAEKQDNDDFNIQRKLLFYEESEDEFAPNPKFADILKKSNESADDKLKLNFTDPHRAMNIDEWLKQQREQKESEHDFDNSEDTHPWNHEEYDEDFGHRAFGVETPNADFDQFILQVEPKASVFERIAKIKPNKFATKMNVLMLGIDSMSQLSFRRKMPKTINYLKELNSVILNGYNIVGDATTAALIPILTGKAEVELPEVRKSEIDSEMVDTYPLIWKNFEEQGYATLFAEDEPSIGVFNLRLTGFDKQPTDHYMRPFWLAVWESMLRSDSEKFCTGKTPHHKFFLNYVKDFFVKYDNVSKFVFAFQSELAHWDNNPIQYMDNDLVDFLHFLNVKGYLDNTLLVIMADHGARYSKVRNTVQGKLEERLPMMSFRFPPWFKEKFPNAIKNLELNSDRLATPFDIHETLRSVLDYSKLDVPFDHKSRAVNILNEIPLNRTCESAGVAVHWCTCLVSINVNPEDKFVQNSALEIVLFINSRTDNFRHMCSELKLSQVLSSVIVLPNEQVLRYKESKDDDQRDAGFAPDINMDKGHYQITLETAPNHGIYEATVEVDFRNETYSYTVTADISRIDRYGDQPKCVQDKYPNLRKYCFCKSTNQTELLHDGSEKIMKREKQSITGKRRKIGSM